MNSMQPAADNAVQFRNSLISVLSHETKGLFANIFWLIEMIENNLADPGMLREMLPELKSVAQKNLDDYTDTLSWIKTQHESFVPQHAKINVYGLFEQLHHFFKQQLLAKEHQLIFEGDESTCFFSDKVLVKLILKKIIENILNSSYSKKVIIFKISKSTDDKGMRVKIADNDTEKDAMVRPQIPDGQISAVDQMNEKMNIEIGFARDIASILNGSIDILSDRNNGTTITLTLPLH